MTVASRSAGACLLRLGHLRHAFGVVLAFATPAFQAQGTSPRATKEAPGEIDVGSEAGMRSDRVQVPDRYICGTVVMTAASRSVEARPLRLGRIKDAFGGVVNIRHCRGPGAGDKPPRYEGGSRHILSSPGVGDAE
jgi:hypothetical protein